MGCVGSGVEGWGVEGDSVGSGVEGWGVWGVEWRGGVCGEWSGGG